MRKVLYIMGVLNDADVGWLVEHGKSRPVPAGTVLIERGNPVESLFILIEGQFLVYSENVEIARLQSGEVVGEISFVDSRPPLASVKATTASRVLAIPKDALHAKLEKDDGFASRFYRSLAIFLADRLRVTTSRFGYGKPSQEVEFEDPDEMPLDMMDAVDRASARFDDMIKRLGSSTG
jgi:CRP/FNR family transcriptional regulator, cyclic AMP receptor protein